MKIIDLHCDTLLGIAAKRISLADFDGHINLGKLKEGGALAQCFAIYISKPRMLYGREYSTWEQHEMAYDWYKKQLEAHKDVIAPAFTTEDILRNDAEGKISSILTIEDGVNISGNMDRLDLFYEQGVRMLALTWNYENCIGYPNSRDPMIMGRGLKPFGVDVVKRMNELGMLIDVSHLSVGGYWDVVKNSKQPFVASHSCAYSLCDHPRNLNDDQLKALGNAGGVCGINFNAPFLKNGTNGYSATASVVEHMKYIADKAGIDAVAFGSDFDGIGSTLEWKDYSGMPLIVKEMEKVFTAEEIDKICALNVLRVFKEVCDK